MKISVYGGSFNPLHNGHLWVIREAAKMFDKVYVVVACNSEKQSVDDSIILRTVKNACIGAGLPESFVEVVVPQSGEDYLVQTAKRLGACWLVRGIRNGKDLEFESTMRDVNDDLSESELTSVYLIPPPNLRYVSSSMIRSMAGDKSVERYVPRSAYNSIVEANLIKRLIKGLGEGVCVTPLSSAEIIKLLGCYKDRSAHDMVHVAHMLDFIDDNAPEDDVPNLYLATLIHDIEQGPEHELASMNMFCEEYARYRHVQPSDEVKRLVLKTADYQLDSEPETYAEKIILDADIIDLASGAVERQNRSGIATEDADYDYFKVFNNLMCAEFNCTKAQRFAFLLNLSRKEHVFWLDEKNTEKFRVNLRRLCYEWHSEEAARIMRRFPTFFHPEKDIRESLMAFGFECAIGWLSLMEELCEKIDALAEKFSEIKFGPYPFEFQQIKEKWGMLCAYNNGGPQELLSLVHSYEEKSLTVCEECGLSGSLREDRPYIQTLCEACNDVKNKAVKVDYAKILAKKTPQKANPKRRPVQKVDKKCDDYDEDTGTCEKFDTSKCPKPFRNRPDLLCSACRNLMEDDGKTAPCLCSSLCNKGKCPRRSVKK